MKVMHCAETIAGGIASYLRDLLPLQVHAYGAGAVGVLIPASQRMHLPVPEGVEVRTFTDHGSRPRKALTLALAGRRWARQSRPDVVHLHSTFAGALLRPALLLVTPRPVVVYCPHGWAFDRTGPALTRQLVRWVERLLAPLSDHIVCISAHELRIARAAGFADAKLRLVRNGIAAQPPRQAGAVPAWRDEVLRVVFVGRFDHQKGLDVLLQALQQLPPGTVQCAVAGQPVVDDTSGALPASVLALGWLSAEELECVYASADLLVVPSRWEGFGLVATEAMRAGLPVLASRVGGLAEVVEDGVTGVLVPAGSPTALAAALRGCTRDRLRDMGQRGKQRFQDLFTVDRVASELDALYRSGQRRHAP